MVRPSLSDPEYRQGVVELLGLLGAGEYLAFERLVTGGCAGPVAVATRADRGHRPY